MPAEELKVRVSQLVLKEQDSSEPKTDELK